MTPEEMLPRAAAGMFAAAFADGSLADLSDDEAYQLTTLAASDPSAVAGVLGLPADALDGEDPRVVQSRLMERFCDAQFAREFEEAEAERPAAVDAMRARREDSAFAYAGYSPADVERTQFDVDNGDLSSLIAARERFYLG